MRRLFAAYPVPGALALFAFAIAARLLGGALFDAHAHVFRSPDQMLIYFAAGWAMLVLPSWGRLAIGLVLVGFSAAAWGWHDSHVAAMTVAVGALAFVVSIALVRHVAAAVKLIAGVAFYIYIFNVIPMYLVDEVLKAPHGQFWWLHIGLGLALGIGGGLAIQALNDRLQQRRLSSTPLPAGSPAS